MKAPDIPALESNASHHPSPDDTQPIPSWLVKMALNNAPDTQETDDSSWIDDETLAPPVLANISGPSEAEQQAKKAREEQRAREELKTLEALEAKKALETQRARETQQKAEEARQAIATHGHGSLHPPESHKEPSEGLLKRDTATHVIVPVETLGDAITHLFEDFLTILATTRKAIRRTFSDMNTTAHPPSLRKTKK